MAFFEMNRATGLSRVWGRLARWNDDRQAVKALMQLTARELDDIGLTRGDVDRMAQRAWL